MPRSVGGRTGSTGSRSFPPCPPYSFSSTHLVLPCPSEEQERVPSPVPSDSPLPDVSSRSLSVADLLPTCVGQASGAAEGPAAHRHLHPTAPSAQTPPLTPQTLTCQQKPRSQGCCNFRNRTVNPFFFFFLNRQNEEKKRREAKTRIAQASPQAAAAGLLTSTQLTSGRPGFCKQLVLFFFPQTKSVLAAKSSCPGGCLWSGGAGRGCFKHGENALAGFGKGQALQLPGLQLARPHRRECEFRASKTFRVMLQK